MNVSNLAFYIGKSANRNVAIYSYNIPDEASGIIDLFNPLDCYWIMREQPDTPREELTFMEKSMAYGYDIIDDGDDASIEVINLADGPSTVIKIKALPNDPIRIQKIDNKYQCILSIPDPMTQKPRDVFVKKVFCHVSGAMNNFVDSIDIIYEDPKSKKLNKYTRDEKKGLD